MPDEIAAVKQRVEFCLRRMEHAIANHDFPGARSYSYEDLKAREQLRKLWEKQGLAEQVARQRGAAGTSSPWPVSNPLDRSFEV